MLHTIAETVSIGSNGVGKYAWSIPRDFSAGTDYRIRVTSLSESSVSGISGNNVAITPPDPTLTDIINVIRAGVGIKIPADSLNYMTPPSSIF